MEAVIARMHGKAAECGADADMVESLYREMIRRFVAKEMGAFKAAQ